MGSRDATRTVDVLTVEPNGELSAQLAHPAEGRLAVQSVATVAAARSVVADEWVDCVVCLHDPPAVDGVEVLSAVRDVRPDVPVLFATETDRAEEVVEGGPTDVVQLTEGRLQRGVVTNRIESIASGTRERGKYEQIFEQANDGIAVHDPETGAILDANRRLWQLLGRDPDASGELSLADLVAGVEDYTEATARERIRQTADGGPRTFEWLLPGTEDGLTWAEVSLEPASVGGDKRVLAFVRDVTDRKENEQLLRDRESQLAAMFDHPSSFAVVADGEGRVVRVNRPALDLVDATLDAVEGVRLADAPWWDGEAADRIRDAVEQATAGDAVRLESRVTAGSESRVLDLRLDPVVDEDGQCVESVVIVGYDITERKERKRELRESRDTLERLHEITSNPDLDFERQVRALLRFGTERFGMDVAFLSRIDERAGEVEFEYVETRGGDHGGVREGLTVALEETYCRHAIESGHETPLGMADTATEMGDDPATERFGLGCYLGDEIVVDGDLYGTLCFADGDPKRTAFSAEERTLLDIMAQWVHQELEGRKYHREIEAAHGRLERTLERVGDAFFALDDDWRVTYVNDAGADVLRQAMDADYDTEELLGKEFWEEVPEAVDTQFYEEYRRAMERQESVTFEAYYDPSGRGTRCAPTPTRTASRCISPT
ncbi:MAG: PAS domain-containing protein [Haloplanus sp.]